MKFNIEQIIRTVKSAGEIILTAHEQEDSVTAKEGKNIQEAAPDKAQGSGTAEQGNRTHPGGILPGCCVPQGADRHEFSDSGTVG